VRDGACRDARRSLVNAVWLVLTGVGCTSAALTESKLPGQVGFSRESIHVRCSGVAELPSTSPIPSLIVTASLNLRELVRVGGFESPILLVGEDLSPSLISRSVDFTGEHFTMWDLIGGGVLQRSTVPKRPPGYWMSRYIPVSDVDGDGMVDFLVVPRTDVDDLHWNGPSKLMLEVWSSQSLQLIARSEIDNWEHRSQNDTHIVTLERGAGHSASSAVIVGGIDCLRGVGFLVASVALPRLVVTERTQVGDPAEAMCLIAPVSKASVAGVYGLVVTLAPRTGGPGSASRVACLLLESRELAWDHAVPPEFDGVMPTGAALCLNADGGDVTDILFRRRARYDKTPRLICVRGEDGATLWWCTRLET
jgi:hypothetical protein